MKTEFLVLIYLEIETLPWFFWLETPFCIRISCFFRYRGGQSGKSDVCCETASRFMHSNLCILLDYHVICSLVVFKNSNMFCNFVFVYLMFSIKKSACLTFLGCVEILWLPVTRCQSWGWGSSPNSTRSYNS